MQENTRAVLVEQCTFYGSFVVKFTPLLVAPLTMVQEMPNPVPV